MEKQPVDDLFARKLRDAEVPVGPDVFTQLEQRMGIKPLPVRRSMAMWWQLAGAACLLIALTYLYMTGTSDERTNRSVASKQVPLAKKQETTPDRAMAVRPVEEQPVQQQPAGPKVARQTEANARVEATYPASSSTPGTLPQQQISQEPVAVQLPQLIEGTAITKASLPVTEPPQIPGKSGSIDRISSVTTTLPRAAERTVVLTINEPEPLAPIAVARNDKPIPDPQPHQTGLSGLFGKIKQLKNGEILAKATVASSRPGASSRFGRVLTEVKESLKNETTLE